MARKKKQDVIVEIKETNNNIENIETKTNEDDEKVVTKTNEDDVQNDIDPQNPTNNNEEEQQKVTIGVITAKGGLRIREEQSLDSKIIDVIPYNKEIEILEIFEEWVKVERGYMLKKFIEI